MKNPNSQNREKYEKIRKLNLHKMLANSSMQDSKLIK